MKITLTGHQVKSLVHLHKSQTDKRKADRIKIILLLNNGYSQKEVADILLLDQDTITEWKKRFLERGDKEDLASWLSDNYIGYVGKVSFTQITHLRSYLSCFNVGTKMRIRDYLMNGHQVQYSMSGLQKLLQRIRMSHKKIRRIPGKANVGEQASFIGKIEELLLHLPDNQAIMFMDAVHPQHNTVCSKVWTERGSERWIQSNTGRERVNINGIYNPLDQRVFTLQSPTINAQSTIELMKKTIQKNPHIHKIHLVSDNARYNKCKEVCEFLASQDKIEMIYLPPYSPNLNLIERLWKFMYEKAVHLKYFDTFPKFKKNITSFFDNLSIYKEELKTRINFQFQTFENVHMATA